MSCQIPLLSFINDTSHRQWWHQTGSERKDDKQTLSESCCEFIGVGDWCLGDDGVRRVVREGRLLSCLFTSAPAVWLMARAARSAEGLQCWGVAGAGRWKKEKNEVGFVFGGKTQPCAAVLTAQVVTNQLPVMIGPCGLFCLAAYSNEVMIVFETEEVKWCDCQQDCTENTSWVLICCSDQSVSPFAL